jgi:hypothetical protein
MFYKKFIGQSGKRVVTLHVAPNDLTAPAMKDKDEILMMPATPTASVTTDRSSLAPPLSNQVRITDRDDTFLPLYLASNQSNSQTSSVINIRLFYSNCVMLHYSYRLKGRLPGSNISSETAAALWTCSRASCALKLRVTSAGT